MHLEGPWLSTIGKKRGKQKFASAAAAKQSRELAQEWEQNQRRWAAMSPQFSQGVKATASKKFRDPVVAPGPVYDPRRDHSRFPSVDTGLGGTAKRETQRYTGTEIIGIGQLHKSNCVPVLKKQDAEDIARMRR
jgi:hypothetical protein